MAWVSNAQEWSNKRISECLIFSCFLEWIEQLSAFKKKSRFCFKWIKWNEKFTNLFMILRSSKVLVNFFSQWSTLVKQTDIGMPNTFMFPWMNWTLQEEKSASFQTNQVERENHKPRPTSIQCSSIIFMHFLLFAKLGGWNCKVSRISWLPSKLIGLLQDTTYTYTTT